MLCRDFWATISLVLRVDSYPLPRSDDLFVTLSTGKGFSTLDLSRVHLQMVGDSEVYSPPPQNQDFKEVVQP